MNQGSALSFYHCPGADDAVYRNSIDLVLEVIARKGVARKAWLLIFVNVQFLAFTQSWYAAAVLLSSADMLCTYTRGSFRGFVLTCKQEVILHGL